MRGGLRLAVAAWTVGLVLGPMPLAAQSTPAATTNAPAPETVGPRELQNFSLSGTVTRPADQPPVGTGSTPAPSPASPRRAQTRTATAAPPDRRIASAGQSRTPAQAGSSGAPASANLAPPTQAPLPQPPPSASVTTPLPPLTNSPGSASTAAPNFAPQAESSGRLAPQHGFTILPWLLAAAALAVGAIFLFWRNRSREAFAGGPRIDMFSAPELAPAPTRAPPRPTQPAPGKTPPPAQQPAAAKPPLPASSAVPGGVVSTGLRPWLEITIEPLRCIVEEAQVRFEFEIDLFNSGSAPARAVLVEATVINAGASQDGEIGAFFARPANEGERIAALPPLQRMTLRSQVVASRESVQAIDIADRQVFVPLIAFNALYRWSGGEGQTSASYLLGRDTKGAKLAPLRLDLGPRIFRGIGARLLPSGVRR